MKPAILLTAIVVFGFAAQAEAVLLSDLINTNGSVTSGNLTFDNFNFSGANAGDSSGNIIVSPVLDGLTISGLPNLPVGYNDSTSIGYQVHIGNGETINAATMTLSLSGVTGTGQFQNSLSILSLVPSETLLANATVLAGNVATVTKIANSNHTDLFVMNNSTWTGPLSAGDGVIPVIQETFFDPPAAAVPEPSTWLLLGSGVVGLAFARRKLTA